MSSDGDDLTLRALAAARTETAATPTGLGADIPQRVAIPETTFVTEVVIACSFEGRINAVIGLGQQRRFEAYELAAPARLVIEVR